MQLQRRAFLSGLLSCMAACRAGTSAEPPGPADSAPPAPPQPDPGPKSLLVLGGTGFLGPHVVRRAMAEGWEVVLFNRGKTNTHLFPELEKLRGNRDGGLQSLQAQVDAGRRFGAVIDTSGYVPRIVGDSAKLLADAADRYIFVSSVSVYAPMDKPGVDERGSLGTLDDPTVEQITGETYGPLKALSEQAAQQAFDDRAMIIRPGLIVGPGDSSDRFTYWPVRAARGGPMIAPGTPNDPVQYIDVRDLADWMVASAGAGRTGVYNAVGPAKPTGIGELIDACIRVSGSDATPVWIPADVLAEQQVAPWMEMTVWVPPQSEMGGMAAINGNAALANGLTLRPVDDTIRDTLEWWNALPPERREKPRAGLAPDKEQRVLDAWQGLRKAG